MIHGWITLFQAMFQAKSDRINLQLMAQFVNGRLQREGGLWGARSTICADAYLIGHHLITAEVIIGAAIAAAEDETSQEDCRTGVRSGIKNDCSLHRYKCTVTFRAKLKG